MFQSTFGIFHMDVLVSRKLNFENFWKQIQTVRLYTSLLILAENDFMTKCGQGRKISCRFKMINWQRRNEKPLFLQKKKGKRENNLQLFVSSLIKNQLMLVWERLRRG